MWVILFALVYRMADNMLTIMINPFLLHIGFDAKEISTIYQVLGTMMMMLGVFLSRFIIEHFGVRRSLLIIAIAHMCSLFLYLPLSIIGKSIPLLYFISIYDAITGGMIMTVQVAYISSLCKGKYLASQYALYSSAMGMSRVGFPVLSGLIVDYYGFTMFYGIIFVISLCTVLFTAFVLKREYI